MEPCHVFWHRLRLDRRGDDICPAGSRAAGGIRIMNVEKKPSVLCVHLYDDFSGSSNVCSQVLDVLNRQDMQVRTLVGSHGEQGFIRSRHVAETFPYRLFKNRLLLLSSFFWAQVCLFWKTAGHCARGEADV